MKPRLLFPLLATALLGLAACGQQKAETSVPAASNTDAASAASSATPAAAPQVLESNDKAIRITIPSGQFASAGNQPELHPEGIAPEDLTLLQHDAAQNITVYAARLGTPKRGATDYFRNLSAALKSSEGFTDVQTGAATENRMNYRFTQTTDAGTLRENCIAIYDPANLYNVCANSSTAAPEALAATLKNVSLLQDNTLAK